MRLSVSKKGKLPNVQKKTEEFLGSLPSLVANEALNHYAKGFERGGKQTDASSAGWLPRKKEEKGTTRAILVKTGALRRSLQKKRITRDEIVLGTSGVKYASYHNDGDNPQPKREFLGRSQALNKRLIMLMKRRIKHNYKV